jgi:drug/metabolite transporter (DMT)-like permease
MLKSYIAFAVLCLCWGSTFLQAKVALQAVPPFFLASLRFLIAGSFLLIWLMVQHRVRSKVILKLLPSSLLSIALNYALLFWGLQFLPSGISGVMNFAGVALALPLVSFLFGLEKLSWGVITGLLLGLAGLFLLMTGGGQLDPRGVIALTIGALVYAFGSLIMKRLIKDVSPLEVSTWQMLMGGVALLLLSLTLEQPSLSALASPKIFFAVSYLTIASLLGFTTYTYLLSQWPLSRVSSYNFICPAIALVLGALILGEKVSGLDIVACVLLITGAMLSLQTRVK